MSEGLLADLVLGLHLAFLVFVVGGQLLVLLGWALAWDWTRNLWLRLAHLAAILFVTAQTWAGLRCPLSILEDRWRLAAGQPGYAQGFIADWASRLVYYSAAEWVFRLLYSLFALLVVLSFAAYRPRRR